MKITKIVFIQDGKECDTPVLRNPYSIETTLFVKDVGRATKVSNYYNIVADGNVKYIGNYTVINTFKRLSLDVITRLKVDAIIAGRI